MKTGVFAGSFCPITKGHVDAIEKAASLVEKLYVMVGFNVKKHYAIPDQVRESSVRRALAHLPNVEVRLYSGLTTDFCKQVGATVMIKSVRNSQDLQEVIDLADVNRDFWDGETVFVVGDKRYRNVSGTLVRELAAFGQDVSAYVPENCLEEVLPYLK